MEAWYTTALDIEEVLPGAVDSHVHVVRCCGGFGIVFFSYCVPACFRHAHFEYQAHVRLRFKLAAGVSEPWTLDGGIPQEVPCVTFTVALHFIWCMYLEAQDGTVPQQDADHLKCISRDLRVLFLAARFTAGCVSLFGQDPAPSECVLVNTSCVMRRIGGLSSWMLGILVAILIPLFVVGLLRLLQGFGWSLSVVLVSFLPLDFHGRLRAVRSIFIRGALHGIEASLLAKGSCSSCVVLFFFLIGLITDLWPNSFHVRGRDKTLLRSISVRGV